MPCLETVDLDPAEVGILLRLARREVEPAIEVPGGEPSGRCTSTRSA